MNKKVKIIMGSDSDLPVMQEACKMLEKLGIDYQVTVISAHRTPEKARSSALNAEEAGYKVIIAGAGKAAHLAGVIAAYTVIPVIGVPIRTSTLGGADSLYSMVQMPGGIPVATVALNGAKNAALLAAQIIAVDDQEVKKKLIEYRKDMRESVNQSAARLESLGYKEYIKRYL